MPRPVGISKAQAFRFPEEDLKGQPQLATGYAARYQDPFQPTSEDLRETRAGKRLRAYSPRPRRISRLSCSTVEDLPFRRFFAAPSAGALRWPAISANARFPLNPPVHSPGEVLRPASHACERSPLPDPGTPDPTRSQGLPAGLYKWFQWPSASPYRNPVHHGRYFPASRNSANTAPCGSASIATRPTPSKSMGRSSVRALMSSAR